MTEEDTFNRLRKASYRETCDAVYHLMGILPSNTQYEDRMDDPIFLEEFIRTTGWTRKEWFDAIRFSANK